ncbi:MAG: sigma-54 interaction domain-containing protein [Phycisphaeraceae bacterium]
MLINLPRAMAREIDGLLCGVGLERLDAKSIGEASELMRAMPIAVVVLRAADGPGEVVRGLSLLPLSPGHRVVVFAEDASSFALLREIETDQVGCFEQGDTSARLRAFVRGAAHRRQGPGPGSAGFDEMLGDCEAMREVYTLIAKVAPTDAAVLICGESGSGKELVADAIHRRSERGGGPFVAVNCGAIAENLIESQLFGHEKGAFTGAHKAHAGVFEQADGGTLFLDEITEMPLEMQVRLLRVLETSTVRRLGSEKDLTVDVRVVAATNRDPQGAVDQGLFREDLMFRLAVFPLTLPPLRERGDDVVLLARHFLSQHNHEQATDKRLSPTAEQRLKAYDWPGNVRQLRNVIQRAYIIEDGTMDLDCLLDLLADDGPVSCDAAVNTPTRPRADAPRPEPDDRQITVAAPAAADPDTGSGSVEVPVGTTIDEAEKQLILKTMQELDGDKPEVARVLGISLKTLYNRLNSYESQSPS